VSHKWVNSGEPVTSEDFDDLLAAVTNTEYREIVLLLRDRENKPLEARELPIPPSQISRFQRYVSTRCPRIGFYVVPGDAFRRVSHSGPSRSWHQAVPSEKRRYSFVIRERICTDAERL